VIEAVNSYGTRTEALNALLAQQGQGASATAAASGTVPPPVSVPYSDPAGESGDAETESPSSSHEAEERDVEMEGELTEELGRGDAFSDYDIDVTKEGEALSEYLALLDSALDGGKPTTSQ